MNREKGFIVNDRDAVRRVLFTVRKEDFRVPTSSRCAAG